MCDIHKTAMLNIKSLDKYIGSDYSKLCVFILVCYFRTTRYLIIVFKEQLKYINITDQLIQLAFIFVILKQAERHTGQMAELTGLLGMCR